MSKQDEFFYQLVPMIGSCATLEGELLRAANKIQYDLWNNGFGNNWSGAWNFLYEFMPELASLLTVVEPYKCGRVLGCASKGTAEEKAADAIVAAVVARIEAANGVYTPSPMDMYDLSEPEDYGYDEDEGDELEYDEAEYDEET